MKQIYWVDKCGASLGYSAGTFPTICISPLEGSLLFVI